ncbi:MAG: hypothetical protein ACRCYA_00295 [Cetobacterium sp.]|uniref:hypothetical protein n=1 Tax=Cetobacterium sp. TaxID=2071632 RepID=UPI003F2DA382
MLEIEYNSKVGAYVNSKRLSELLGCTHKDLIKRIEKLNNSSYISYDYEVNKYAKNCKIKYYRLKYFTIKDLRIDKDIKEYIKVGIEAKNKEISDSIKDQVEKFFNSKRG